MEIDVINYIKEAQKHGLTEQEIKKNLLDAGWEASVVEDSLAHTRAMENQLPSNHEEDLNLVQKKSSEVGTSEASAITASPSLISLKSTTTVSGTKTPRKTLVFAAVAVGIVLAGSAYAYYHFVYEKSLPTKIWNSFTKLKPESVYSNSFNMSYSDKGVGEASANPGSGFSLKDFKLNFDGTLYIDATEIKNPTSESNVKYSFASGNSSFSTGFSYRLINQILYLNVGENPFLNSIFGAMDNSKKTDWLSVDLNKLSSELNNTSKKDGQEIKNVFGQELQDQLKQMWEDAKLIKIQSFVGVETENKLKLFHFKNELDKVALKQFMNQALDKMQASSSKAGQDLSNEDLVSQKQIANAIIDKIQIKEFDTWINATNFRMQKIHLVTNAPSVISMLKNVSEDSKTKTSDSQRIFDLSQLGNALEMYYKDHGYYPESKDGIAQDMSNYLYVYPKPPVVSQNGVCNDYYGKYYYVATNPKVLKNKKVGAQGYEITSCLEESNTLHKAGIMKMINGEMSYNIPCPGKPETCPVALTPQQLAEKQKEKTKSFVDKLNFDAEFKFDSNYFGFGEKKKVTPPESFTDLLEIFKPSKIVE